MAAANQPATRKSRKSSQTESPESGAPSGAPGSALDETAAIESPEVAAPEIAVIEKAPRRERGDYHKLYKSRKAAEKQAAETALMLVAMVDGLATVAFGGSAAMNEFERGMIAQPLERILARMDLAVSETAQKWADPVLLIMGLIAWGSRIARERGEGQPRKAEPETEVETEPNPEPGNNGNQPEDLGAMTKTPDAIRANMRGGGLAL